MKKILYTTFTTLILLASFSLYQNAHAATIGVVPFNFLASLNTLSNGLVGYWTFDGKDVVNGVVMDRSGNGNNGNLINIATSTFFVPGKIGQAFNFDGVGSKITINSFSPIIGTSDVTISAWVNLSVAPASKTGILGLTNSSYVRAEIANTRDLQFEISDGVCTPINFLPSNSLITLKSWHYVVFRVIRSGSVNFFIDGIQTPNSTNISSCSGSISGTSFTMGLVNNFLNGSLDDVRIYNRALSAGEISQLYAMGLTKSDVSPKIIPSLGLGKGLTGYWTFDGKDVVNGVVQDKSGNSRLGTLVGIATSTFFVPGKIGQAFNFNSVQNGYVGHLSPQSNFMSTTDGTMSAWVYPKSVPTTGGNCNSGDFGNIIQDGQTNAGGYVWMGMDALQRFCFGGSDGSGNEDYLSSAQTLNKWYLVTWVHTGGVVYGYVNGVQVTSGSLGTIANQSTEMTIGQSFSSHVFNGMIDDARIYNRALSASEISQLYNQGISKYAVSPNGTSGIGLSSGLVGYWTFDGKDVVNGVAMDKSGNGNNGNLINIATSTFFVPGKIGQGFNFHDANVYASTTNDSIGVGVTTICAWVYPRTNGINQFGIIVANGKTILDANGGAAQYRLSSDGNTHEAISTLGSLVFNVWTHICASRDLTGTTNFYINGSLSNGTILVSGAPAPGTHFVDIGDQTTGATHRPFDGKIDDVRIYNRALSATEVQQLYNMGR